VRCVVVGVDGSENARHALEWAIALGAPHGATVVAVHALGLLDRLGDERVPTAQHREEIEAEFRDHWCAPLDAAGVPEARVARDGPPADVLLAVAEEHDADLVVVGERGIGGGPARVLGSTSRRVLEDADRPVLVVPAPPSPPPPPSLPAP
jgi:nucleotide-binding universal stress UspA family protein